MSANIQPVSKGKRLRHYLQGLLAGAVPLLVFALCFALVFYALLPVGAKQLGIALYSALPLVALLLWVGDLLVGILSFRRNRVFSLGIFTMLLLLLILSPAVLIAWGLSSDGFTAH